ncbi:16S rRNA (guanine(966)-N(2))-methyltransferase RsmD [Spirochaetota bacterium]
MRIITGKLKNRKVFSAVGKTRKATEERVREALFNILGDHIAGSTFLDMYAGTGLVGLEAYSRGALLVTFIELDKKRFFKLKKNLIELEIPKGAYRIYYGDSCKKIKKLEHEYDYIYIDPPFYSKLYTHSIDAVIKSSILKNGSIVILERHRKVSLDDIVGVGERLEKINEKRYGSIVLEFYEYHI